MALDVAKKYNSKVILLTCIDVDTWSPKYYDSRVTSQLVRMRRKVTKKHLEELESIAEKNDVSVKSHILISKSVVRDIVSFAKSKKCDLVVIGSHGRTGFNKWLLGSITNSVSQKIKCPILIVK
jgi:nucleotide-binding universal stress UspA family protein